MLELEKIDGIQKDVILADFTTFHLGGKADFFYELTDVMDVSRLIRACQKDNIPYFLLAFGSNVIFSDKGFRGLVIRNVAKNCSIGEFVDQFEGPDSPKYRPPGRLIEADSGTFLSKVIQFAINNGLTGMEKLIGIPGTIGGAVRGNAGAFGIDIRSFFEKALVYDSELGDTKEIDRDTMNFTYRHSSIKENSYILLKIVLRAAFGDSRTAIEEMQQTLAYRAKRHPHGYSAGSFFKNPSNNSNGIGQSAGQIIEACGFKGKKVGGAYISDKHANFLMNDGTASMDDVLNLYTSIQQAVWEKFQLHLKREVLLVGEHEYIQDKFNPALL